MSPEEMQTNAVIAHGVIMALVFGMLLPLGAAIMHAYRGKGFVWLHGGWQIFSVSVLR